MVETRAAAKILRFLAIALICFAATMDAETKAAPGGIEGTIVTSPAHGGPSRLGEDNVAPMAATAFLVETPAGKITTFTTDAQGKFKVELPPGKYTIRIQQPMMKGRGCSLADIEVTAGSFKKVRLDCDSGMR
jgi:hypothetical protein